MAVAYAIMMTRNEDLTWQMRAIRVLPMFVLPAVSSVLYSAVVKFTRMRKYLKISEHFIFHNPDTQTIFFKN